MTKIPHLEALTHGTYPYIRSINSLKINGKTSFSEMVLKVTAQNGFIQMGLIFHLQLNKFGETLRFRKRCLLSPSDKFIRF